MIAAAPQQQQQPPAAAPAAGSSREQQAGSSRQQGCRSDVRPFFGVPLLRFGYEIRWCFAVSDVFRKGCLAVCGSSKQQQAAAGSGKVAIL